MSITAVTSTAAVIVWRPPPAAITQRIRGSWASTRAAGSGRRRAGESCAEAGLGSAAVPMPYAAHNAASSVVAAAANVVPSPSGNATSCSA